MLFSVCGPALFESLHVLCRRDTEPAERQDHGPDGDVGLAGFANTPAPRATDDRRSDVALRSAAVEHGIEFAGQRYQLLER
jgi:hypothetical protein